MFYKRLIASPPLRGLAIFFYPSITHWNSRINEAKLSVRYLNSKPRRSLYRLRLKFEETTRVVCTDYSWSLQKVLLKHWFKCVRLLSCCRILMTLISIKLEINYHGITMSTWQWNVQPCPESDGFTENKDFSLPLQRLYCAVLYLFSGCIEASDA